MAVFRSRSFGEVPLAADGAYVTREVSVGSRSMTRSLFLGMDLDQTLLDRAAALVDTLPTLDLRAREAIAANADNMPGYVTFHLEELDDAALHRLFDADRSAIDRAAFLAKLEVVGVNVHHRPESAFSLVLDYSLGRSYTDELLAVSFDMRGHVLAVTHES